MTEPDNTWYSCVLKTKDIKVTLRQGCFTPFKIAFFNITKLQNAWLCLTKYRTAKNSGTVVAVMPQIV